MNLQDRIKAILKEHGLHLGYASRWEEAAKAILALVEETKSKEPAYNTWIQTDLEKPVEPTAPVGWEEDLERHAKQLKLDGVQTGVMITVVQRAIKNREREIVEGVEGMKVIPHEPDKMYKNGCLLCEKQAVWNDAHSAVLDFINKPNT